MPGHTVQEFMTNSMTHTVPIHVVSHPLSTLIPVMDGLHVAVMCHQGALVKYNM